MPEKPQAKLKCPYCQSDLNLTVNSWLHCWKCRRDIMLTSPDKVGSLGFYLIVLTFIVMIVIYADRLFF